MSNFVSSVGRTARQLGIGPEAKHQCISGGFILTDTALFHQDNEIALPPKERAVLEILLQAAGEVVSKDTLLESGQFSTAFKRHFGYSPSEVGKGKQ